MTDAEFECLLQMSKNFVKYKVDLPQNNESSVFDLVGNVPTEKFFLDIDRRGKIELSKFKIQTRYATTKFPLVRIDIFDFVDKRIDFMCIFHAFCKYCNINTDNIQGVV